MSLLEHKEIIQSSAIVLLKDHDIKQSTIFDWIREAIKEHSSSMPTTCVLFNKCFGGYGFSKEFKMFRAKKALIGGVFGGEFDHDIVCDEDEYRTEAVDDMYLFGKAILERDDMQAVRHALMVYHNDNIRDIFYMISEYNSLKNKITFYKNNISALREYLATYQDSDTTTTTTAAKKIYLHDILFRFIYDDEVKFDRFSRDDLAAFLEEHDESYVHKLNHNWLLNNTACLDEKYKNILQTISQDVFDDIRMFMNDFAKRRDFYYKKVHQHALRNAPERVKTRPFIVNLFEQGYQEVGTWIHQEVYNPEAILYLLEKCQNVHTIKITASDAVPDAVPVTTPDAIEKEIFEDFGLLCAGSAYSNLGIKEVPSLLEWKISEYDGRERVVIV